MRPVIPAGRWLLSNRQHHQRPVSPFCSVGFSSSREDRALEPCHPGRDVLCHLPAGAPPWGAALHPLPLEWLVKTIWFTQIFKCNVREGFFQKHLLKGYFLWQVIKPIWTKACAHVNRFSRCLLTWAVPLLPPPPLPGVNVVWEKQNEKLPSLSCIFPGLRLSVWFILC